MKPDNEVDLLIFCHLHLIMLDTLEFLGLFLDHEELDIAYYALHCFYHWVGESGREEDVLRRDIYLGERFLELIEALMIRLLLEELVRFVVDDHLQVAEVKLRITLNELVFEIARHCHHDVALVLVTALAKHRSYLGLTAHNIDHLLDLPDELSGVCQDDNLDLEDAHVYLHEAGHYERSRLSATILRLKGIVDSWVAHDMRYRMCLDYRWLEVVKL